MIAISEDFRGALSSVLNPLELGTGRIEQSPEGLRMVVDPVPVGKYSDSQLYNYAGRKRSDYPCQPPLRMTVRAWASHSVDRLVGTAGFGFWNQPLMPGEVGVHLPRAVWFFFCSQPSNMALAQGVPGYGWKAATLDASRLPFLLLAPTAPLGFLLMRVPALYRRLWPVAQKAVGVSEAIIQADLAQPHTYRLDWLPGTASFFVDDVMILKTPYAPRGSLGFVTWLDNQYAIVTPQGHFALGLTPVSERQWLALESLVIEPI